MNSNRCTATDRAAAELDELQGELCSLEVYLLGTKQEEYAHDRITEVGLALQSYHLSW